MQTNPAVEENKTLNGPWVRGISLIGKEKVYGGNDLVKSQVLSSELTVNGYEKAIVSIQLIVIYTRGLCTLPGKIGNRWNYYKTLPASCCKQETVSSINRILCRRSLHACVVGVWVCYWLLLFAIFLISLLFIRKWIITGSKQESYVVVC